MASDGLVGRDGLSKELSNASVQSQDSARVEPARFRTQKLHLASSFGIFHFPQRCLIFELSLVKWQYEEGKLQGNHEAGVQFNKNLVHQNLLNAISFLFFSI